MFLNKKSKSLLGLSLLGLGGSVLSISTVSADEIKNHNAGDFDLTKQATKADYPVMFDRPTGINASALGNAIINLGTSSDLYKKAVTQVPELKDATVMNSLLNKAMNGDKEAKAIIVKLINFYNSLGGTQITTQSGEAYTVDNLDKPINTIAVAFTNGDVANNKKVSDSIQAKFGNVKTVQDVMNAMESYGKGLSDGYKKAFDEYNAKLKAPNADVKKLSTYEAVKPVLDAYENMYSNGASIIRKAILDESGATESAVAFFESAVLTGGDNSTDNGNSSKTEVKRITKYVDRAGKELEKSEEGTEFKGEKTIPNYTRVDVKTEGNVRTYIYEPTKEVVTKWVDESGKEIKSPQKGKHEHGKIDGYTYVKTTEDKDGNVVHIFKAEKKVYTYWFDNEGNPLKPDKYSTPKVEGALPDKEGDDVKGYTLKGQPITVTEQLLNTTLKGSTFQVGDVINIYEKAQAPKEKIFTRWVEEGTNKDLKEKQEGSHPDKNGDAVPGYERVSTTTDEKGNVTNTYKLKKVETPKKSTTYWKDEEGKNLQQPKDGEFPDTKGDAVPGYTLLHTNTTEDEKGNKVVKNVYRIKAKQVVTHYIDKDTNKRITNDVVGDKFDGAKSFKEQGYKLVDEKVSEDGKEKTYFYEKEFTTRWVDENGKDIEPTEKGKKYGAEKDLRNKGYNFVSEETDNIGLTKVYKYKKQLVESPKEQPKTPAKKLPETGDSNLPLGLGALGLLGAVALGARRKQK